MTLFYLGTCHPAWMRRTEVPLFISHRALLRYKDIPQAIGPWALDSGGFTEVSAYGEWRTSPREYVEAILDYMGDDGNQMQWAAPQDWMCEPFITAKTGLSVLEHQKRTVANFLELRDMAPEIPFIPVLQGWSLHDYYRCWDLYEDEGVRLEDEPLVGLGSVCRRQDTTEIGQIVGAMYAGGLRLHGFGVKKSGLTDYGYKLASSDSMAWSFIARRRKLRLEGCEHARCHNCRHWAEIWGAEMQAILTHSRREHLRVVRI